jgi:hypothetical protein
MENFKTPFAAKNPYLITQWHPTKNVGKLPNEFGTTSKEIVWWICDKGHEWEQAIFSRQRSRNCPVCLNQKILPGVNDLATLQPELARQWSFEKNVGLLPSNISAGSNKKFWWVCKSGHDFEASVSKRVSGNTGCPFCKNKTVLRGFNDLATTNVQIAETWHPTRNKPTTQHDVIAGTAKKFWWICKKGHDYQMSGDKRIKGIGCPVCSNYSLVTGVNDLAHTHPELALEWNLQRNSISPAEIVAGSHKRIWWLCDKGHEWQASPVNRVYGTGCPSCSLGGFNPSSEAQIYFITNENLQSRKVGITNLTSARLESFQKLDWTIIKTWDFERGHDARKVEKLFFEWLRLEIGLPAHLDGQSIGKVGGWTETFSKFGPQDSEIVAKLDQIIG